MTEDLDNSSNVPLNSNDEKSSDVFGAENPHIGQEFLSNSNENSTKDSGTHGASTFEVQKGKTVESRQKPHQKKSVDEEKKKKPSKKKRNTWWIKVAIISLVLAAFFSFLSEVTADAEHIVVILLLLLFLVFASILFDAIGVAVTSCDDAPIIAMASRKIYGAKTAIWLVKNSSTVSSICNDVIGDIFGIISGACSAAIALKIAIDMSDTWQRWIAIITAAIVSAVTIGGKAFMKTVAINNSKEFVMFVARLLAAFVPEERRRYKKEFEKKKQQKAEISREKLSKDPVESEQKERSKQKH